MRIPFGTQSYTLDALPIAAQRCINVYPEEAPQGAKSPVALLGWPGLTKYADYPVGPVRGALEMKNELYVLSGQSLWKQQVNGDRVELGQIPGERPVKMVQNGTQVAILAGVEQNDAYIATTDNLTPITDPDFRGASDVTFLDGYFIWTVFGSDEFFISDLYDGLSYDASQFATAEGSPDGLVGCVADHRELWLMGKNSVEIWYNSGNADFPFERTSGAYLEKGCAARDSIAQLDNTVFWVGSDRKVYRAQGYAPARVSSHAIEEALQETVGLEDVQAFPVNYRGHSFYMVKKRDQFTFVYDVATDRWHERCSNGDDVKRADFRGNVFAEAFDLLLFGDDRQGCLYFLDFNNFGTENGETIICRVAAPPLWAEAEKATLNNLIIDFGTGIGLTNGQGDNPQVMLRWSDDGARTWSYEHWRNLGPKGTYGTQVRWDRLGQFGGGGRVLEITISDPVERYSIGAYATAERGRL